MRIEAISPLAAHTRPPSATSPATERLRDHRRGELPTLSSRCSAPEVADEPVGQAFSDNRGKQEVEHRQGQCDERNEREQKRKEIAGGLLRQCVLP